MKKKLYTYALFIITATLCLQTQAKIEVLRGYDPFIDRSELHSELGILKKELRKEMISKENLLRKLEATEQAARNWRDNCKKAIIKGELEKSELIKKIDTMQQQIQTMHKQDEKEFVQYARYATPHNKRKMIKDIVNSGNVDELKLLINKKNPAINLNIYGLLAWLEAIKSDKKNVIDYLQTIIPINTIFVVTSGPRKGFETSILEELALENNMNAFKKALEYGANPKIVNSSGYSLIEELALQQDDKLLPFIELLKDKYTVSCGRARVFANPSLTEEDPTAPNTIAFLTNACRAV